MMISSPRSGCGKALFGIGLTHELRRRGVSVSCCVLGPNLRQSVLYRRLSGRYVRTLDADLLSPGQNLLGACSANVGADIVLVHGGDGLFDGPAAGGVSGSNAEMAALLHSPVLMVLDSRGSGSGLAAEFSGLSAVARDFKMMGAVINRCQPGNPRNGREFYDQAFDAFGEARPLGVLPEFDHGFDIPPRNPAAGSSQTLMSMQALAELADWVADNVDIKELLLRASQAPALQVEDFTHEPHGRRCRIGVTDDSCFNLLFQDNLDLLRYYGADVVPFSPLADVTLPKRCGALYFTGASLAEYAPELARNEPLKEAIREFVKNGGVIYSEGAGTAYLSRKFRISREQGTFDGVGILPGAAVTGRGNYMLRECVTIDDTILGPPGLIVKGISTGEWRLQEDDFVVKALRADEPGNTVVKEGFSPGAQILATFSYFHMGSNPDIARHLVEAAEIVQKI